MGWNVNVSMRNLRFGHTVERHMKFYIFIIAVKHEYTVGGLQVLRLPILLRIPDVGRTWLD